MTKKKDKDWNIQEKVVAIIEHSLDTTANIKQDINLPVLGSASGRTRQCDVAIYQGQLPRQTLSIVEVQKRGAKPDINTFGGWLKKKDDVGAQHLICVSEKGFPNSIIEEAERIGPTIRLMTIKNLLKRGWPFPSNMFNSDLDIIEYVSIDGLRVEGHHLMKVKEGDKESSKNPADGVFKSSDSESILSTADVADSRIFSNPQQLEQFSPDGTEYPIQMDYQWNDWTGLHYRDVGNKWVPIRNLSIRLTIRRRIASIEWNFVEYFQNDWGNGIAWAVRGDGEHNTEKMTVVLPIKKLGNTNYVFGKPMVIGNFDAFILVNDTLIKASNFDD